MTDEKLVQEISRIKFKADRFYMLMLGCLGTLLTALTTWALAQTNQNGKDIASILANNWTLNEQAESQLTEAKIRSDIRADQVEVDLGQNRSIAENATYIATNIEKIKALQRETDRLQQSIANELKQK